MGESTNNRLKSQFAASVKRRKSMGNGVAREDFLEKKKLYLALKNE